MIGGDEFDRHCAVGLAGESTFATAARIRTSACFDLRMIARLERARSAPVLALSTNFGRDLAIAKIGICCIDEDLKEHGPGLSHQFSCALHLLPTFGFLIAGG